MNEIISLENFFYVIDKENVLMAMSYKSVSWLDKKYLTASQQPLTNNKRQMDSYLTLLICL